MNAVSYSHPQVVDQLLAAGADVNATDMVILIYILYISVF